MKNYPLATVCSIILLASTIIVSYKNVRYKEEIIIKDSLLNVNSIRSLKQNYLENSLIYSNKFNDIVLENQTVIDTMGSTHQLIDIAHKAPLLIFRYQESHCSNCVTLGMLKLELFASKTGIIPTVFAKYANLYPFKSRSRGLNRKQFPNYNVETILEIDQLDVPVYFILNKDLSIGNVFIPEKAFPDVTNKYLESIEHLF